MLLLGALLGGRLLRGRPVRGPVRLGRVAYSTRLRTSWRPASWRRASWRRVFAWRRPWLMCLRYLARGRERWPSIREPRRLTPRDQCRAQASRRTGLATAHWCADAAQQQLARRPGGAARSTRQEKQRRRRAHRGIAWGLQRMCSPAIAAWSDGLSRSTHVQIASWVTALLRLCVMVFCRVCGCVP